MNTSITKLNQSDSEIPSSRLKDFTWAERIILEIILPHTELPYSRLCDEAKTKNPPLINEDFNNALNDLVKMGYLSSFYEDGELLYLVEKKLTPDKRDEKIVRGSSPDTLLDSLENQDEL
jgi:hypothetical protein